MAMTLQSAVSRIAVTLLAAAGITLSTALAWVLYELLARGSVDSLADAWVRGAGRYLGSLFSMDPTVAAFFLPLATFAAISLAAIWLIGANG
jgi:cytochrome P450